ncbi:MAG: hypothetical protein MRJ67_16640 [Nitrospirales bacterium]|nr:hypothetical protein [Nitrospira sp.]MDR4462120.1 hypothetical protein [Nitrospirales bacterium]MDR4482256.1 hypothetical protein [Nitrospirales bacterium]
MPKRATRTTKTTSLGDSMATSGKEALGGLEGGITALTAGIWEIFHEHPNVGGVLTGGLGIGAAMTIGVAEIVAGVAAGYLGYRIFAYGETFTEAIEKTIEFREGKLSKEEL